MEFQIVKEIMGDDITIAPLKLEVEGWIIVNGECKKIMRPVRERYVLVIPEDEKENFIGSFLWHGEYIIWQEKRYLFKTTWNALAKSYEVEIYR